jgi:hypothetical protein
LINESLTVSYSIPNLLHTGSERQQKGKTMRKVIVSAAISAAALAMTPLAANADPIVNGVASVGEYGLPTAIVATNPLAPTSNFGNPSNSAQAGYNIYLSDVNDTLFGAVQQTGGTAAGFFANLYFDIDPATGTGGPELGIEVANGRGFVAGSPTFFDLSSRISFATTTTGGLITSEFSIANSVFRDFIAGAVAGGYFPNGYTPQNVRLNLSQSLSYSVAGGPLYGPNGLGTFSVTAPNGAVPEPATWAMMILGMGAVGVAMRTAKRRSDKKFDAKIQQIAAGAAA